MYKIYVAYRGIVKPVP